MEEGTSDVATEDRLVSLRWPNGVRCVDCGSAKVSERKRQRRLRMWRCVCGKDFTVTVGTVLQSSKLRLSAWETAALSSDNSSSGLQTLLGVSAVTARRVSRVLRSLPAPPGDALVAALVSSPDRFGANHPMRSAGRVDPLADSPEAHRLILSALRVRLDGAPASFLAKKTGLSASYTRKCLRQLEYAGFVRRELTHIRWGYGRRKVCIWGLATNSQTIAALPRLPPTQPDPSEVQEPTRVPPEYWNVFWSGMSAADLRLPEDALYIADTMIGGSSFRARNWALTHLPVETLQQLRTMRGYDTETISIQLNETIRVRSRA